LKKKIKMQARLLNQSFQSDLKKLMRSLKVEEAGIKIMFPKAKLRILQINKIPSFSANILKQELLSLGGDLALPREALIKKTLINSVLLATDSQIKKLLKKIAYQGSYLKNIGFLVQQTLKNFNKGKFILKTATKTLRIKRPLIMGIINLTPDSFSGDGLLKNSASQFLERVKRKTEQMLKEGADLIDIGGESTRPGAKPIKAEEEIRRVIPALKVIKKNFPKIPVSVDTHKPLVAKLALKEGADIINDITGLRNPEITKIVAKKKAGVIIMHMKGKPSTMQKNPFYKDVVEEVYNFLAQATQKALDQGIEKDRIVIDVGIGFGKRVRDNLELIKYLYQFKSLGYPILIGVSRKSFIGKILRKENPQERILGTLVSLVVSIINGAKILRVHDVACAKEIVKMTQVIFSLC